VALIRGYPLPADYLLGKITAAVDFAFVTDPSTADVDE